MRNVLAAATTVFAATAWLASVRAQAPSFDKLTDADRAAFQKRFENEIWPLMSRGGKKTSCLGCHSGGQVTALRLTGKLDKDFPMLVKDGFFLPDDAGSLLGRITDTDKERRMPLKGAPWAEDDVKTLRAFVADLDKKQRK